MIFFLRALDDDNRQFDGRRRVGHCHHVGYSQHTLQMLGAFDVCDANFDTDWYVPIAAAHSSTSNLVGNGDNDTQRHIIEITPQSGVDVAALGDP